MHILTILLLYSVGIFLCLCNDSLEFNYLNSGNDWGWDCKGSRQSPINIKTKDAKTRCTEDKEQIFEL